MLKINRQHTFIRMTDRCAILCLMYEKKYEKALH